MMLGTLRLPLVIRGLLAMVMATALFGITQQLGLAPETDLSKGLRGAMHAIMIVPRRSDAGPIDSDIFSQIYFGHSDWLILYLMIGASFADYGTDDRPAPKPRWTVNSVLWIAPWPLSFLLSGLAMLVPPLQAVASNVLSYQARRLAAVFKYALPLWVAIVLLNVASYLLGT